MTKKLLLAIVASFVWWIVPASEAIAHGWHTGHYHGHYHQRKVYRQVIRRTVVVPAPIFVPVYPAPTAVYPRHDHDRLDGRVDRLEDRVDEVEQVNERQDRHIKGLFDETQKLREEDKKQWRSIDDVKAAIRSNNGRLPETPDKDEEVTTSTFSLPDWSMDDWITVVLGILGIGMLGWLAYGLFGKRKEKTPEPRPEPRPEPNPPGPTPDPDPEPDPPAPKDAKKVEFTDSKGKERVVWFSPASKHPDGRTRWTSPWTGWPILEANLYGHCQDWFAKRGMPKK